MYKIIFDNKTKFMPGPVVFRTNAFQNTCTKKEPPNTKTTRHELAPTRGLGEFIFKEMGGT